MKIAKYKKRYILKFKKREFDNFLKKWVIGYEYMVTSLIPLHPMITLLISTALVVFLDIIIVSLFYPDFLVFATLPQVFVYLYCFSKTLAQPTFYEEETAKKYIDGLIIGK